MQEGTVVKFEGGKLTVRIKSGGTYTHAIDPSCKIVVEPSGTIDDVVEGDGVQFSGQPPVEVHFHRQYVGPVASQATPPVTKTKPTVSKQLAGAHDDDETEHSTTHSTTHTRKHK